MQRRIGLVTIETLGAATPKFTAPMLLIPGMWCSAAVWRRFMGYLAHRGWTCHAVALRGHADAVWAGSVGSVTFDDYRADVAGVVAECDAAPIVIGHDLGGLLALHCTTAAAVVALAPLVPARAPHPVLARLRTRLAARLARPLRPPRGALRLACFGREVPGGATLESARAARQAVVLAPAEIPRRNGPTLLVAGDGDLLSPAAEIERLAQQLGAVCHRVAAGHAMPWESGWEQRVAETHRWLIQTLGEPLLALTEGDDA